MKVSQRTNLKLIVALLIFCQVDFNAARTNSVRGSSRNAVNKMNKGKRVWGQTFPSTNDYTRQTRTEAKTDEPTTELNNEERKGRNEEVPSRMWLELETVPPPRLSAKRNGDVILECIAIGSPPPVIYWLKNGKPMDGVFSYELEDAVNRVDRRGTFVDKTFAMAKLKSKLPLRCLRPEDEAEYTCVADNDGRQLLASTTLTLDAEEVSIETRPECQAKSPLMAAYAKKARRGQPPIIVSSETLHMEAMGSDIILPCRGFGRPRPSVAWINSDGHRVFAGKKYQVNSNGDLVIRNLSWNEMGEYTCISENNYGSDSSATFLYPLLTDES